LSVRRSSPSDEAIRVKVVDTGKRVEEQLDKQVRKAGKSSA
jgi:hypothetical protein